MSERHETDRSTHKTMEFRVGITLPTPSASSNRPAVAAAATRMKLGVFCRDLDDALAGESLKVTSRTFRTYQNLSDAVTAAQVELAWMPPLMAARTARESKIEPVVVPIRGESSCYAAALFSSRNSKIRSLADLKDLRVAWADPESMAGHLAVRQWLRAQDIDLDAAFSNEMFVGGHDEVVAAVAEGRVDVGATFVHLDPQNVSIRSAGWGELDMHVIGVTGQIPSDLLAARAGVEAKVIKAVRDALIGDMNRELRGSALALFAADRFAPADKKVIQMLTSLMEHVKLPKS